MSGRPGGQKAFETIFNTIPQPALLLGSTGVVLEVSSSFLKSYDFDRNEVLGRSLIQLGFVPAEAKPLSRESRKSDLRGKEDSAHEAYFYTKGGDLRYLQLLSTELKHGGELAELVVLQDITELRNSEERNARLGIFLKTAANICQLLAREGVPGHLLQGACDQLSEMRGCENAWILLMDNGGQVIASRKAADRHELPRFSELIKRGHYPRCVTTVLKRKRRLMVENDPATHCRNCPLARTYGPGAALVVRLQHRDRVMGVLGLSVPVELSADEDVQALLLQLAGDISAALRDLREGQEHSQAQQRIQELSESEKQLRQKLAERTRQLENAYQDLHQLDEMEDSFLSTISHELRTPLTSIKGFAELLLSYGDSDRETQREFLTIINTESERLTKLIDDLLDLSRIESGLLKWKTAKLAIPQIVERAMNAALSAAGRHDLTVEIDMQPDLPPFWGDRDRLMEVMANLLDNAIKFTPQGGTIRAEATLVKGDEAQYIQDAIKVSVSDTGIGIAPEDVDKVLAKFRQVGHTLTEKPKGIGLGLAICKGIVGHYGGKIWVESQPGKGSTFFFTLPVSEKD